MIENLITSKTKIKLLLKFFLNPDTKGYLRQLAKEFNESTNGIRVELNKLSKAQIIESQKEGRSKIYKANTKHPLFKEIRQIVLKSTGIDKVISDIIGKTGDVYTALLRGDYAVGKDSGLIDLVIVGDNLNTEEIDRVRKKTEKLIDRKISILQLTINEYKKLKSKFDEGDSLALLEPPPKNKSIMILFVYTSFSTFVKKDYEILKKHFQIRKFQYKASNKFFINLVSQIKIFIWLTKNIWKAKYIYIWFADYHSFLPILFAKILKKKSFLVLGGYDVTYIPEIKYGSFSNPLRSFCTKFSIKNASICLPVSYYVEKEAKKRVKKLNSKVIYNGIDTVPYDHKKGKENIVLTVGNCNNSQRIKLKGIDFFVETAKALPNYKFIAIGISKKVEKYLGEIPKNVQLIDKLPHEKLSDFYKKAKIYCQFSLVESFGLSVLEAISFGAIPIISNKGALPEIFGSCSFILKERSVNKAIEMIQKAMNSSDSRGREARGRIIDNFSLENREREIIKIL